MIVRRPRYRVATNMNETEYAIFIALCMKLDTTPYNLIKSLIKERVRIEREREEELNGMGDRW
jgi:hypothetical protein